MTHPTWELKLEGDAALILTPCPGTKEADLATSVQQLKEQGALAMVTALDTEEMEKAGVAALAEESEKAGIAWFHQPIEDDQAPGAEFDARWEVISPKVHEVLKQGGKVVLHCMGGSGRTGMLAAHILLEMGWDLETIKREVKALRPGAFTKQPQIDYIAEVAAKF
ncbi:cyclin-dependent kinase inhibitor 3 family protein [Vibrio sp. JC009]|uniref:cyclin-dependent kinase inhibitor 3 family protein n=1 Tax=Vibrio sp. JC009 TaxID=2912314 RepID=UPI0023AF28F9|nr:cyclin-dependent kinase inhibitor 3 family protein [Vibrio sp. JC009]WED21758.1 cyclin-dependent kinase inhibitor 3 family protein [Vibrio sp. JC009]